MATTITQGAIAGGLISGPVGWAALIGAGIIDGAVIAPRLRGDGRAAARVPRLLDVPSGTNQPGAPTIWAIGPRVRVPCHVLWQSQKVRESVATNSKAGTTTPLRRVYFDAAVSLNDRRTSRLLQLVGNGKLMMGATRNIIELQSAAMVVSAGSDLVLTAGSTADPDFADKFRAGDVVDLERFIMTAGADLNVGYWKVVEVKAHSGSTPSSMRMDPYSDQTVAGIAATAGTPFTPAKVVRVDDTLFCEGNVIPWYYFTQSSTDRFFRVPSDSNVPLDRLFAPGDSVSMHGFTDGSGAPVTSPLWSIKEVLAGHVVLRAPPSFSGNLVGGTSTNPSRIIHQGQGGVFLGRGLFPSGYDPALYYHPGSDDQGEDALLAAAFGTGEVPAYRGTAYQGLDSLFVAEFGDQMPFALEAVLEVDPVMTWAEAFEELLVRHDVPRSAIDTSGIDSRPFLGFYTRGSVPAITAMQPLLMAGQIIGQERDGTIALFDIHNADVVQVANGAAFSDLNCRTGDEPPSDNKLVTHEPAIEDLSTQVGVHFQNADNTLAEGYEPFGMRHPGAHEHQNEQVVDVSNVVLTEKEAVNLAATMHRRMHTNARVYEAVLPCAYEDLLENDIITVTDDDGEEVTIRIVQRDIGSDALVHVRGVAEDVELAVTGSPVQGAAGIAPPSTPAPTALQVVVVDAPAVADAETLTPAAKLAVCAEPGGQWAGAAVYVSVDGSSYDLRGIVSTQATIGRFTESLAPAGPSETVPPSTIGPLAGEADVEFAHEGLGISGTTLANAVAGANWCAILQDGEVEIVAFTTAAPVGGRTWTLGGWLRGLRGTYPLTVRAGAILVMLSPFGGSGVEHIEFPGLIQPTSLTFKVVPAGRSIDDAEPVGHSALWRNVRPLPVRSVQKTIGVSPFDVRFTVAAHWCRQVLPLGTQPPHPMDEQIEAYRFTLYDVTGTQVRFQKDIAADPTTGSPHLRDKWVTFSATEQANAGYTPSGSTIFWIDVQQIGQGGLLGPTIKQQL